MQELFHGGAGLVGSDGSAVGTAASGWNHCGKKINEVGLTEVVTSDFGFVSPAVPLRNLLVPV